MWELPKLLARCAGTLIAPPFCVVCQRFLDSRVHMCENCLSELEPISSCSLEVTGKYTMPVYALTSYTGIIRNLIVAKHYGNRVASVQLGDLVAFHTACPWHNYDLVIPVPLHWTRLVRRGFNPAQVMGEQVQSVRRIPCKTLVRRVRRSLFQAGLDRQARRENVEHIFELFRDAGDSVKGKRILLVDDLMTTGSTLRELARVVAHARPETIGALVAARVP